MGTTAWGDTHSCLGIYIWRKYLGCFGLTVSRFELQKFQPLPSSQWKQSPSHKCVQKIYFPLASGDKFDTFHLFKKILSFIFPFYKKQSLQYQKYFHSDFRIFQHKPPSYDTSVWRVKIHDKMFCQQFQSKLNRLDFQSLFGAPYCSRWGNHCSVFFKIQPNNECQEAGMTFGAVKAIKRLYSYVSDLWTRLSSQRWKPPATGLTNNGNPGRPPCLIQKS